MMRPNYIPETIFGISFEVSHEQPENKIPRMYTRDFTLLRAKLDKVDWIQNNEFSIAASANRPEIKKARKLAKLMKEETGLPCVICSPELDFHQKELLTSSGVSFIQNEKNMFIPFLGTYAYGAAKDIQPKMLSPQAQRIVLNMVLGNCGWLNKRAGELAQLTDKSSASVSNYLGEIAAVSPSLIEMDGTKRILRNPGFSKEEVLERFDPYFSNPVRKTFKIAADPSHFKQFGGLGFLLASYSALEVKTDLAFNSEDITIMTTEKDLREIRNEYPNLFDELPWWQDSNVTVQVWDYPVDHPDAGTQESLGIKSVGDYSLYLSLKDGLDSEDVRVQDALEQIRRNACQ